MGVAHQGLDVLGHHIVKVPKPVQVDIENRHIRAETGSDLGGIGADDATAENRDLGRGDAGDAREQQSAAFGGFLEILRAFVDGHAARDLAHRCEQWERTVPQLDGFIGDGDNATAQDGIEHRFVGGKMEIGEHDLAGLAGGGVRTVAVP